MIGDDCQCQVTIIDTTTTNSPPQQPNTGKLGFEHPEIKLAPEKPGDGRAIIKIKRFGGTSGTITCMLKTEDIDIYYKMGIAPEKIVFEEGEVLK